MKSRNVIHIHEAISIVVKYVIGMVNNINIFCELCCKLSPV